MSDLNATESLAVAFGLEVHSLRDRLVAVERERDEARRAINDPTIARLHTLRDEMLTATVEALGAVRAERDAAVQRLATPIACPRCDRSDLTLGDLPGHLPCLSRTEAEEDADARCARVEAEAVTCTGCGVRLGDAHCGACAGRATVERIADWLERLGYMSPEHVALVRVGAWRGKVSP